MSKSGVMTKVALAVGAFLAIGAAGEARADVFGICWSNTGPVPGDRPVRSRIFQIPEAVSPDIAVPQMKGAVAAFVGPDTRVGFTNCLYEATRVEAEIEELQFQRWNAENEAKHPDITEPVRYIDFAPAPGSAAAASPAPVAPLAPPTGTAIPAPAPAPASAVAPPAAPPPAAVAASIEADADLNREVTERNAEVQKRNDAAKAAFEQQQRAYLDALTRQQAEAERLKREDAEARRRYEEEMAAWRARVEACKTGDTAQCT